MTWDFPHPPRGTCVPGCRSWSLCHCNCGGRPTVIYRTQRRDNAVANRPYAFLRGHHLRVFGGPRGGPTWGRNGIPWSRLMPLANWLAPRVGGYRELARRLGLAETHLASVRWGRHRMASWYTARAIYDLVRQTGRGLDPFRTYENEAPPRQPTEAEARETAAANGSIRKMDSVRGLKPTERERKRARVA